jgi:hypothetical protein
MGAKWTLQQLVDEGYTVTAYCHRCHHNGPLDLKRLAAKLGPDHPAMHDDLVGITHCGKCREVKKMGFVFQPASRTGNPFNGSGWKG